MNQLKGNIASETKISIYEGEWPDMSAIPGSDIPLPVELFVAAPMIKRLARRASVGIERWEK